MNFKDIVNNVPAIESKKTQVDVSTWAQYKMKDGKYIYLNPPEELTEEEKKQEISETLEQISYAISLNSYRYMVNYDMLHGEGAYGRLYYLEPIYDLDLDADLDLDEN